MAASPLDDLAPTERMIVREHVARVLAQSPPLDLCQVMFYRSLFNTSETKDDRA